MRAACMPSASASAASCCPSRGWHASRRGPRHAGLGDRACARVQRRRAVGRPRRGRPRAWRRPISSTSPRDVSTLAGAMLTASHNPATYNGIKLCLSGARPIGRDSGLEQVRHVAEAALAGAPADGGVAAVAADGRVEHLELLPEFAAHVRSFVDAAALRPLKVVADTANGMGGLIGPGGLRRLAVRPRDALPGPGRHLSATTPPTRSSPRTSPTCVPRSSSPAPTSAWPSTATRTGSSSSTSSPSPCQDR